jgi:hypothetical protein
MTGEAMKESEIAQTSAILFSDIVIALTHENQHEHKSREEPERAFLAVYRPIPDAAGPRSVLPTLSAPAIFSSKPPISVRLR